MLSYRNVDLNKFFFYIENYYIQEKEVVEKERGKEGLIDLLRAIRIKAMLHRDWYNRKRTKALSMANSSVDNQGNILPTYEQLDVFGKGPPLQLVKHDLECAKNPFHILKRATFSDILKLSDLGSIGSELLLYSIFKTAASGYKYQLDKSESKKEMLPAPTQGVPAL